MKGVGIFVKSRQFSFKVLYLAKFKKNNSKTVMIILKFYICICRKIICFFSVNKLRKMLNKTVNNEKKYHCTICEFKTDNHSNYNDHINTKKHRNHMGIEQKICEEKYKFLCEPCSFKTNLKTDYTKHLLTRKHGNLTKSLTCMFSGSGKNIVSNSDKKINKCENCNKIYSSRVGLWYHYKKCKKNIDAEEENETSLIIKPNQDNFNNGNVELINDNKELMGIIKLQITENQELKKLLIEQQKQNMEFQSKIIELSKTENSIGNHNNINSNNTTNNFNLNLFLNEQCKDAININEFVNSLQLQLQDLEETGRLGYSEGISKIFIKGLKELDVYKRPIHCSDLKRETLYIKDQDKWEKDDKERKVIKHAIKEIANKNIKQISEWVKNNPDCTDYNSKKNDEYMKMISNTMVGIDQEEIDNNYLKIISKVAKEVVIKKE